MERKHIEHRDIVVSEDEVNEILATETRFRRDCRRREARWYGSRPGLTAKGTLHEKPFALIRTLGKIRPLSHEEIIDLSRRFHAGENAYRILEEGSAVPEERGRLERLVNMGDLSKQQMALFNIPLVIALGKKFSQGSLDYSDYLQAGLSGLMRAIDLYDYTSGYAFSTYAAFWINQAFRDARRTEEWLVCVPNRIFSEYQKIMYADYNITMPDGTPPTDRDIAEMVGITEEKVTALKRATGDAVPLDWVISDEKKGPNELTLGDTLADESPDADVEEVVMRSGLNDDMDSLLATLNEDEKYIVEHRFGLNGENVLSNREIGEHFGITGSAISVRWRNILLKLQNGPMTPRLEAYLVA